MNDFYKKLAMEAGLYVDFNGEPWPKWLGAEECEIAYNKFLLLIIEDCKQTLVDNGFDDAASYL
jgi:hypothetical protein